MFISRFQHFAQKRWRAARLGMYFLRSNSLQLPRTIVLNGAQREVDFPKEMGVRIAFAEVLLADCYRLEKLPRHIGTVLDIGANVGIFCLAARQAFPDATIHAYEPNPELNNFLRVQAKAADASCFMEAVARADGFVRLETNVESVDVCSRPDPAGNIPATAFARTLTRLGGHADLVKMDCEGAEWEIWSDVDAWQQVGHISTEYHLSGAHTHEDAARTVARLGFKIREHTCTEHFGLIFASR